jgi:uncharacterized protein (TIGR02001 family)
MKKLSTILAVAALGAPLAVAAQAKAEPQYTLTGNAGLYSDYRYRGFTQTDYKPAFQGGVDFAHKAGFYAGNWNSNVSSVLYNGASLEMDFYGGYKHSFGPFGLDVGALYYYYPGTGKYISSLDIDFFEIYVGGSYGPVSAKYYHGLTDYFGLNAPGVDTKGSQYLDLSASFDLGGGLGVNGHIGWQKIKNGRRIGLIDDAYLDFRAGVTYDLAGWLLGAAVIGTDEKNLFLTTDAKGAGKTRVVLSASRTF